MSEQLGRVQAKQSKGKKVQQQQQGGTTAPEGFERSSRGVTQFTHLCSGGCEAEAVFTVIFVFSLLTADDKSS